MNESSRSSAFRPDIEGLRGIAVLIVVAFHCGLPGFSGGFIGVDVFFVLSGYLITGLLVKEAEKTSRIDLAQFYARRIRRLLPASALMLLVILTVGAAILAPGELAFAARASRASALYLSNVFFGINAADYFSPNVETNPMLHTWSLAVEEQFYLFWPLLMVLGLQVFRSRRTLLALLLGLTAVSLGVSVWSTSNQVTFAFYQLPARAWEFGLGGLAVLPARRSLRLPAGAWLAAGWLGVAAILGSALFIVGGGGFPGWIALVPVMGTVVALVSGAESPHRGVGVVLDSAVLQILGTLSYSWYLWHWPFLVFSGALFPNITTAGKLCAAAAALAVAGVTHHLVENPIRFHPYLMARPLRSLVCGAAITAVSLCAALFALRFADRMAQAPGMKQITAAANDLSRLTKDGCFASFTSAAVKTCTYGDRSGETAIVVFGDSHAAQWFNPLQRMAESHGWKLITMVKSACPAPDIRPPAANAGVQAACGLSGCGPPQCSSSIRPVTWVSTIGGASRSKSGETAPGGCCGHSRTREFAWY